MLCFWHIFHCLAQQKTDKSYTRFCTSDTLMARAPLIVLESVSLSSDGN